MDWFRIVLFKKDKLLVVNCLGVVIKVSNIINNWMDFFLKKYIFI